MRSSVPLSETSTFQFYSKHISTFYYPAEVNLLEPKLLLSVSSWSPSVWDSRHHVRSSSRISMTFLLKFPCPCSRCPKESLVSSKMTQLSTWDCKMTTTTNSTTSTKWLFLLKRSVHWNMARALIPKFQRVLILRSTCKILLTTSSSSNRETTMKLSSMLLVFSTRDLNTILNTLRPFSRFLSISFTNTWHLMIQ